MGGAFTVSETVTVCVAAPAATAATMTLPVYDPIGSPDGFTRTLSVPGVEPLLGLTASHPLPTGVVTLALAVKATGALPAVTFTACVGGSVAEVGS